MIVLAAHLTLAAALFKSPPHGSSCHGSQLSVGDEFVPRDGPTETVKTIAIMTFGPDVVGFVYQARDGKLFAQARSGMPPRAQKALGVRVGSHQIGQPYQYSAIVQMKSAPMVTRLCRQNEYIPAQ